MGLRELDQLCNQIELVQTTFTCRKYDQQFWRQKAGLSGPSVLVACLHPHSCIIHPITNLANVSSHTPVLFELLFLSAVSNHEWSALAKHQAHTTSDPTYWLMKNMFDLKLFFVYVFSICLKWSTCLLAGMIHTLAVQQWPQPATNWRHQRKHPLLPPSPENNGQRWRSWCPLVIQHQS